MTKDLCRETYAERSVGDRREAPGAHAESQQMSTGGTHERGVRNQRPNRVCREVSPEASCGRKSAQRSYWHSETEGIPTRPHTRARRDGPAPSRVCRKTYAERSVGVRRKAPGAHAESQQMSTARTRVRGVTTKQRRELAKRDGLTDGILR